MKKLAARLMRIALGMQRAAPELARAGAQRAVELAREAAPVDTGELRAGILVNPGTDGAAAVSTAAHASMVEHGTRRMPPRPYMLPAARAARGEYLEAARKAVKEVLS